ncbi:MAG: endo-1,4-beta-xylanase [Dysgonamonadaceae bacterium]|nr:endo-1,4-beta-xylanase [Dysgonamonadaceae bacterium]
MAVSCCSKAQQQPNTLKDALAGKFYIGTAMNVDQITGKDTAAIAVIKQQFNSIVAENCMKSMYLQPKEGEFFFDLADQFVQFGEENNMNIIGHCLIWHSQAPAWFFVDDKGKDVSREVLIERMKNHITTIVGHYKGRINGWDVVNEAIMEDGSLRKSKFYEIIGDDFMKLAFQFAHEADPDAELYYNDYNEWHVGKRDAIVAMVKDFQANGIRIDAIGMQGHFGMDYPQLDEYQAAMDAYAAAGVKVMVTELDMSALPRPGQNTGANIADVEEYQASLNPFTEGLSEEVSAEWTKRMAEFFQLFIDNSDKIQRVTMWGVSDATSWKNDFPVRGRTDYPLLFDRNHQPKPIVQKIIDMANAAQTAQ